MQKHWEAMSDEALAAAAAKAETGAFTALAARLLPRLRRMAEEYDLPGMERDDLVQEGFLGVMSAVRHYRPEVGDFLPYAIACARNSMNTASRPEDRPAGDEEQPEALVEASEFDRELHRWMQTRLTEFERRVWRLSLVGYSYAEIASLLSSHSKAVDNALQRVRRKLRKFYSTHSVSA